MQSIGNNSSILLSKFIAGASLHQKLLLLRQRVVVIISADLAHTHDKNGPYGFSPSAEPFDQVSTFYVRDICGLNEMISRPPRVCNKSQGHFCNLWAHFNRATLSTKKCHAQQIYAYQNNVTSQTTTVTCTICDWYPAHFCVAESRQANFLLKQLLKLGPDYGFRLSKIQQVLVPGS